MEIRKLNADEIEAKVKTIGKNGAQLLLYKTARTDRQILDEVFGAMNWTSDYKEIKGNLYCGIGCRENSESPFVWKWDCGIESREDGEGNEKKGEASDSFKRAGFQWGIGVELYTSPFIWANVPTRQITDAAGKPITKNGKPIYALENSFDRFSVTKIDYDDTGKINNLVITNSKGEVVYEMHPKKQPTAKPEKSNKESFATVGSAVKAAATKAQKYELSDADIVAKAEKSTYSDEEVAKKTQGAIEFFNELDHQLLADDKDIFGAKLLIEINKLRENYTAADVLTATLNNALERTNKIDDAIPF